MIFTAFRFFALLSLAAFVSCATAKNDTRLVITALKQCGTAQVQQLVPDLIPTLLPVVEELLAGSSYQQELTALESALVKAGVANGEAIVTCIVSKVRDQIVLIPGAPLLSRQTAVQANATFYLAAKHLL